MARQADPLPLEGCQGGVMVHLVPESSSMLSAFKQATLLSQLLTLPSDETDEDRLDEG